MIGKDKVVEWVRLGRILPEQGHALIEEAKRREAYDPYEGQYIDGTPADVWAPLDYCGRAWVVNVYCVARHYGGPEEGGWWYNSPEPVEIAAGPFRMVEDAEEVRGHVEAFARLRNEGNIYSMGGGHEYVARVESCIPHDPTPAVYC